MVLHIAKEYSTPITDIWQMDAYEFITICVLLIEEQKKTTPPMMSLEEVQAFQRMMV